LLLGVACGLFLAQGVPDRQGLRGVVWRFEGPTPIG
jgi:hypothetical protein